MVAGLHVHRVEILVRVWEMRGCRVCAIVHKGLEIRAIMIVVACLRIGDAIDGDVIFTEQRKKEITGHTRGVRKVHILSRSRNQFNSDVEFDL